MGTTREDDVAAVTYRVYNSGIEIWYAKGWKCTEQEVRYVSSLVDALVGKAKGKFAWRCLHLYMI